jgi:hypothetical protein
MHGENTLKARNLWAEQEDHVLRREVVKQGMPCSKLLLEPITQDLQGESPSFSGSTASRLGKPIDWRAIADKLPGRSNKGT